MRVAGCGCGGSLVKMALGPRLLVGSGVVVVVVGWDDVQVLCRLWCSGGSIFTCPVSK